MLAPRASRCVAFGACSLASLQSVLRLLAKWTNDLELQVLDPSNAYSLRLFTQVIVRLTAQRIHTASPYLPSDIGYCGRGITFNTVNCGTTTSATVLPPQISPNNGCSSSLPPCNAVKLWIISPLRLRAHSLVRPQYTVYPICTAPKIERPET